MPLVFRHHMEDGSEAVKRVFYFLVLSKEMPAHWCFLLALNYFFPSVKYEDFPKDHQCRFSTRVFFLVSCWIASSRTIQSHQNSDDSFTISSFNLLDLYFHSTISCTLNPNGTYTCNFYLATFILLAFFFVYRRAKRNHPYLFSILVCYIF